MSMDHRGSIDGVPPEGVRPGALPDVYGRRTVPGSMTGGGVIHEFIREFVREFSREFIRGFIGEFIGGVWFCV